MKILLAFFLVLTSSLLIGQDANCACCTVKHSEFDFWIGTWEVTNPDGTIAGSNTIRKIQGNCVLEENWTSATPGYTGISHNFYNAKSQKWEQIWIDNKGVSLHLEGNRIGNQMIMRTKDEQNAKGQTFYHQLTWTDNEDGTVRQLWETIINNDQITVAFDGLYKRSK